MFQVIVGWERGLIGMCRGERRRLVIPSDLAYGGSGHSPNVPSDAALVFEIELIDFTRGIAPIHVKDEL